MTEKPQNKTMNTIPPRNRPKNIGELACRIWFLTFAGCVWAIVAWMIYLAITA